ncbi:hypothetical protein [Vibrio scophthalmi]|uniref:Uncharacterized protein n=1 Tax=Vibrio scophthalmi TaxID=45658 RepID=A0A1C7FB84_9VIBR|nr:hypothetical protein [Vibrio scophthalmi]ANU36269.1 hypothetical protein VSVS05_01142 [Vibrio scophthalmi]
MDIQYIFTVHGKGIDMAEKKQLFQQALELIIDGISLSETEGNRSQAGAYLMGLVVADNQGQLDAKKIIAIQSIIEMAAETESPVFKMS